jgi:S-disulfanyl-L-cysteine oxidoreductase SoxD
MRCNLSLLVMALTASVAALAQAPPRNLGRTPSAEEIRAWDIDVSPEGNGLPPGSGTAKEGAAIYARKCAACHGPSGDEGEAPPVAGGKGKMNSFLHRPVRTAGNYWPFATMVWDYINRAMPLKEGGSLKADEVYAVTAFLLYKSDIIGESDVIDAQSLPKIQMPNRNKFRPPPSNWKPGMPGPFLSIPRRPEDMK